MKGPPLGPVGEDITWPNQVAPRGLKASSTRKIKPQTSNPFVDVQHQEPNTNLAWPEPLQPRYHAPTPVWLVTTDDQCAKAVEHAPHSDEWGVVLVGAGRPVSRGLRRDPAVIEASRVLTRIPCPLSCDSWYLT